MPQFSADRGAKRGSGLPNYPHRDRPSRFRLARTVQGRPAIAIGVFVCCQGRFFCPNSRQGRPHRGCRVQGRATMDRRTFLKIRRQRPACSPPPAGWPCRRCRRAPAPRRCASCRRPTSPISTRSGARNTSCATPRLLVWDTLYGVDSKFAAAAPDGRERGGLGRRPDLDLQAALRPQVP